MPEKPSARGRAVALFAILFFIFDRLLTAGALLPEFCNEDERWVRDAALKILTAQTLDTGVHKYPGLMPELTALVYGGAYLAANLKALPRFESLSSLAWHLSRFHYDFAFTVFGGRLFVIVLSALALYLVYALARKEFGDETALIAVLLTAFTPGFQFASGLLKPDALVVIGVLFSVRASLLALERGRTRDYLLAGLAGGFCLAAKYHFAALIPLAAAHFLRGKKSFLKEMADARLLAALFAALAGFAVLSPGTWLDLHSALSQLKLEAALQHKNPLFLRSSEKWWHAPVLFQFAAALPLALGLPGYLLSLAGVAFKTRLKNPRELVVWSYPAGFLLVMIAGSDLGAPHLYASVTPFFGIAAARAIAPWLAKKSRAARAAAVSAAAAVAAYNLLFVHSFIKLETGILRDSVSFMRSTAAGGKTDLAFLPYYPNPDLELGIKFMPQFMLSRKIVEKAGAERLLIHHAFYRAFLDNPELWENPAVADMLLYYLNLEAGKEGFKETDRFTGTSMNLWLYKKLMPDLGGMKISIYKRKSEGSGE